MTTRRASGCSAERGQPVDQGVEDGLVLQPLAGERVGQLDQVVAVGGEQDVLAHVTEGGHRVGLRDHVELAADGELNVGQGEQLEVAGAAAGGAADPLGDGAELAVLPRVERQDAVGLAQVHALQDDALSAVQALPAHAKIVAYPRRRLRGGSGSRPGMASITTRPCSGSIDFTTWLMAGTSTSPSGPRAT